MPRLFITVIFLFLSLFAVSQLPTLSWAGVFEAYRTTNSNGRTVGVDEEGNVYSAGLFEGPFDFDPGPATHMMTGAGPSEYGIYISKLDANGNFVWVVQVPTSISFGHINLKVDKLGNVYLASDLNNAADMDPGPGVFTLTPAGFRSAFVLKLNTNGGFVWAKQFSGSGDTGAQGYMIELDADNNIIVGGSFNNTVDFDPGPGVLNLTSSAHIQAYVVKLTNDGNLIWAKQFGNGPQVYSGSTITDIKCNAQNDIVITGSFQITVDFDPGPGVFNVSCSGGSIGDGFICKLDKDFNFKWVKTIGQQGGFNNFITPTGVDIDRSNNIVIAGFFIGNFDFDPGPAEVMFASTNHDCFTLKLDPQGNYVWAKVIGHPTQSDAGYDVMVDDEDNVYTVGSFGTSVDFDPGPGVYIINSPHYGPAGLIKLSPAGEFVYAAAFQSISFGTSGFTRMAIDPAKNIYVAGAVSGVNDFEPGPGVHPVTGASNSAPFVLKLSRCVNITTADLDASACNSYTLNSHTYNTSGTYVQTIPNSTGCDSIITLRLTLNKKMTEQTKAICEGQSFFAGGANQTLGGVYYDTLRTVLGCDSIITTRLTVNPKPTPDLGVDKDLCEKTSLVLTPGSFSSYQWQDNSTGASFTINAPGLYYVTVTNSFDCVATDSFRVTRVLPLPADFLKDKDSVCSYKALELSPSRAYTSYHWSTGSVNKNIPVQIAGTYRLTVTDANGCTGVDSTVVFLKQCMTGIYIPTAFTPDNNGKNDIFKPSVFGKLVKYQLTVYNRWGGIIFQSSNPDKGWDGTIAGIPQDANAFVWTCTYQFEGAALKTEKGTLMLIR